MIKPVIKYFICSLIFANALISQNVVPNINMHYIDSGINTGNTISNPRYHQYQENGTGIVTYINEKTSNNTILKNIESDETKKKLDAVFFRPSNPDFPVVNKPVKQEFNIISSFRENIRFGGFWDKYAIINFNPSVNLKPVDFISIYANENLSCFVPVTEIKEYVKLLCIHSAAILAVDNSVKLFFNQNAWVAQAAGFIAKNLIISILKSQLNSRDEKIYNHDSYYFAVSVRF